MRQEASRWAAFLLGFCFNLLLEFPPLTFSQINYNLEVEAQRALFAPTFFWLRVFYHSNRIKLEHVLIILLLFDSFIIFICLL